MDHRLTCNKCYLELDDRAIVTTCCHIICEKCAAALGLSNPHPQSGVRICPACGSQLANPDDAVLTVLRPTEEYKTSVLSGLSPTIIMECAGRGLAFWSYQTSQAILYERHGINKLNERYGELSDEHDKVIARANAVISKLEEKISVMNAEQMKIKDHNEKLAKELQAKIRACQTLEKGHRELKHQQEAVGIQRAAEDGVEELLAGHHAAARRMPDNVRYGHSRQSHGSSGSKGSGGRRISHAWENQINGSRVGLGAAHPPTVHATPSTHRQHLPPLNHYPGQGSGVRNGHDVNAMQRGTPARQPLGNLDPNRTYSPTYGMSAGVKMGRPQGPPMVRASVNGGRGPAAFGYH